MCTVGQTTQTEIGYHVVRVTNKRIMTAFARGDFVFLDKWGSPITDVHNNITFIFSVCLMRRVQKNRRNGQEITRAIDLVNPRLCIVAAAIRIYFRSLRLDPDGNRPLGFYVDKRKVIYLTGRKINVILKDIAAEVYTDLTPSELSTFSVHMWRVTACVLLQQAGKNEDYIKMRLQWAGESYKIYLRNTSILARQHLAAVSTQTGLFTDAYSLVPLALPELPLEEEALVDTATGPYAAF